MRALEEHGFAPIDLVVVSLYPFAATVASGADPETVVENIDIGGPTMIRAAAKNSAFVAVLVDPGDYGAVLSELRAPVWWGALLIVVGACYTIVCRPRKGS